MIRLLALLIVLTAVAGCGNDSAVEPPEPVPAPADGAGAAPENVMEDIELHLWPSTEAPGQDVKPLLSIRAQRVTGAADDTGETSGEMAFEGAVADVPAQDADDPRIHFEAARGVYLDDQRAVLQGGVTAEIDTMTITLEDITWEIFPEAREDGNTSMAFSDNPLKISSPTQNLEAARLRLYPDTEVLELYEVSGEITFMGVQP